MLVIFKIQFSNRFHMSDRKNTPAYSPWKDQTQSIMFGAGLSVNEEYEVLMEFQLKRQKQKNIILQQRLKNKQVFIQQMKQYQQELTFAFEKCQDQLNFYKKRIEKLQKFEIRQYLEQIADLKHRLIKAEQQKFQKINSASIIIKTNKQKIQQQRKTGRFKSVMSSHRGSPKIYNSDKENEQYEQTKKHISKINKFIQQFLSMSSVYIEIQQSEKLTTKLKIAWKWVKSIVKQWHSLRQEKEQFEDFVQQVKETLQIDSGQLKQLIEQLKKQIYMIN